MNLRELLEQLPEIKSQREMATREFGYSARQRKQQGPDSKVEQQQVLRNIY